MGSVGPPELSEGDGGPWEVSTQGGDPEEAGDDEPGDQAAKAAALRLFFLIG